MAEEFETPAAADKPKFSPKTLAFLIEIRVNGPFIAQASAAVGRRREIHSRMFRTDKRYRAAFEKAVERWMDSVDAEAHRRAVVGVKRLVLYHGKPVMVPEDWSQPKGKKVPLYEVEYSDTLLLAYLKARRPDIYRDRVEQEVTHKFDVSARLKKGRDRVAKLKAEKGNALADGGS